MLSIGLIHGDLSEFNVFVGSDGAAIIDLPRAVNAAAILVRSHCSKCEAQRPCSLCRDYRLQQLRLDSVSSERIHIFLSSIRTSILLECLTFILLGTPAVLPEVIADDLEVRQVGEPIVVEVIPA